MSHTPGLAIGAGCMYDAKWLTHANHAGGLVRLTDASAALLVRDAALKNGARKTLKKSKLRKPAMTSGSAQNAQNNIASGAASIICQRQPQRIGAFASSGLPMVTLQKNNFALSTLLGMVNALTAAFLFKNLALIQTIQGDLIMSNREQTADDTQQATSLSHAADATNSNDNARLIAAAPDLLAAAQAMMDRLENLTTDEFQKGGEKAEREMLAAAIAKATQG